MLNDAFERALLATPSVIAGVRLRPFSAWHAFLLESINSPFMVGGEASLGSCLVALCAMRGERKDGLRNVDKVLRNLLFRLVLSFRIKRRGLDRTIADIEEHIQTYTGYPEVWANASENGVAASSSYSGAPWQWYMVSVCASEYGIELDKAWNMPAIELSCLKAILAERNGGDSIVSDEEIKRAEHRRTIGDTNNA